MEVTKKTVAWALLLVMTLPIGSAFAQVKTLKRSDMDEVWAREEEYWRIVKSNDAKGWADLWSEDFVGWPDTKEHPVGKAEGVAEFAAGAMWGTVVSYELHRENVAAHGDAVITFYGAKWRSRGADGKESTYAARFSHTWMKRDGRWVIVGGMSTPDSVQGSSARH